MIDETSISEQEIVNDPENITDLESDIVEDETDEEEVIEASETSENADVDDDGTTEIVGIRFKKNGKTYYVETFNLVSDVYPEH